MSKISKVIVTILVIVAFIIIFSVIVGIRTSSGAKTPGMIGLAALAGMIGAIKAVWNKDKIE